MAAKQANSFAALPAGAKIFLLFAGLGVMTAGYYGGFHMALEDETASAQRKHGVLQQQLEDAHARQTEFLKLREELAGREALDQQNLRILPVTAEIPAFLDDLNRLAELSGLEMANVQPAPEVGDKFFVRVPVTLSINGGYHQLAKFFYNISRLERAINMEDIVLNMGKGKGATAEEESIRLSVSVRATTFRRSESK